MKAYDKWIRLSGVCLCELAAVSAFFYLVCQKAAATKLLLAAVTMLLLLLPELTQRLLHCRLATPLYLFMLLYALGPMCGYALNFYYLLPGWDKLLHICGGIVFAVIGLLICGLLLKGDTSKRVLTAVFALCFSMAISMTWEFVEFGGDQLLGTDMQDDTVITKIHSHTLDNTLDGIGSVEGIEKTVINGQQMPWNGYLDIGLIDTMLDMLLETAGALVTVLLYLAGREKRPWLQYKVL